MQYSPDASFQINIWIGTIRLSRPLLGLEDAEVGAYLKRFLKGLVRIFFYSMAALGLVWTLATVTPLDYRWATWLAGPRDDPAADVLIVLGGSVLDDGTIGESSYWRSVYAVRVFREGGFRTVVICGRRASVAMREFLQSQGVPSSAIQIENGSSSTRENALFARKLLAGEPGRKVLLTSDYHMFRARRVFQKAGIEVLPRPFPDVRKRAGSWRARWPAFLDLLEETIKIGYYFVRGWI
jgi:uncharacterized SAM-binding protein YcdF (DUF218 family)